MTANLVKTGACLNLWLGHQCECYRPYRGHGCHGGEGGWGLGELGCNWPGTPGGDDPQDAAAGCLPTGSRAGWGCALAPSQ